MPLPSFSPTHWLHVISRWSLVILTFLLPVLFLPWTTEALEINKQTVLVMLTAISAMTWLASMVLARRVAARFGWFALVPILLALAAVVSAAFSLSGYHTWVGGAGQEYTSVLTTVTLVLLALYVMNAAGSSAVQRDLLYSLLASASLVGLFSFFTSVGWITLPFSAARGFNPVGTVNALALFLLTVMFLGLAAWLVSPLVDGQPIFGGRRGTIARAMVVIVTVTTLFHLLATDFWLLWALCIFGVLVLAGFGFLQASEFTQPGKFILPFIVLIISAVFLFFPTPINVRLPVIVSPSYGTSFDIAKQTLSQSAVRLAFGSGPGTYQIDYLKSKPASINETVFWNVPFDRAKSHLITVLATMGVVGATLWALMVVVLGLRALGRLVFERDHEEWRMTYVLFVGWSVLMFGQLMYASNLTLLFLFWLLTGLLASQVMGRVYVMDFVRSPRAGLAASFGFVLLLVVTIGGMFITGQRYVADVAFAKAVQLDQGGATLDQITEQTMKAASANPFEDTYYRNLSSALLARAGQAIQEANGAQLTPEQQQQVAAYASGAVNAAVQATALEPNTVANWSQRGLVYREVMPFSSGAEDFAAATFEQAISLEPNNPIHYANLGRVHLAVADRARMLKSSEDEATVTAATDAEVSELVAAEEAFLKAIELKGDYAPAHYYLAAVYERQGKLEESAARLYALTKVSPTDVGLGLQLGLMLARMEEYEAARAELERVVGIAPNYSNALWYLSAVYELLGDDAKALETAKKVLELNPGNELVLQRVAALEQGASAPVEELPEPVEEGEDEVTDVDAAETP